MNSADLKSLMSLLRRVLADASAWCCVSTTSDFNTIRGRVEHEGISFLTISLAAFGSDFDRSLADGQLAPNTFLGFKRRGSLPCLFRGLTEQVFDAGSGRLLDSPSIECIRFIRQLTLMWKKMLLPCSETRIRKAYDGYIKCDTEVWERTFYLPERLYDDFGRVSALLWARDLSHMDLLVHAGDLVPRHGPGATADKLCGNAKFDVPTWPERLDREFPADRFLLANAGYSGVLRDVDFREPETEQPVRVITVPKTLKTPRIIAIEPACMQYAQQALLQPLVEILERSDTLSGSLGFTDQRPNQELARLGSIDGSLATLDLSEASDRVSNRLVKVMLQNHPSFARAVEACRSTRADVPGQGIVALAKFASMGSALCFPIEAMVFLTLVLIGYERKLSRTLTFRDLQILKRVRIYGDDIIVPTDMARDVVDVLHDYGMVVNTRKSFWTGRFRESCGRDFFGGHDVTVTYVRRLLPTQRRNAPEMESASSLRNQLYRAGMWGSAKFLDQHISALARYPTVGDASPVLGRVSLTHYEFDKICPYLQKPIVKGLKLVPRPRPSKATGHGALLKFFLKKGPQPYFDKNHLERYGRPLHVDIKARWGPSQ